MAKKKAKDNTPKPAVFHTTPFSSLKGVVAAKVPAPEPPRSVAPQLAPVTDDSDLFLREMDDVKRLGEQRKAVKAAAQTSKPVVVAQAKAERQSEAERLERETFARAIGQLMLDVTFSDSLPEDEELKPLGANRLRQLKRGVISVERQIDLHGLTREEALIALGRFLQSASAHGEKAVLVITGKGNNSPGEPVLQQAVTGWLRDAGKKLVVEFAPAPREMGGSGAFVVFLRG